MQVDNRPNLTRVWLIDGPGPEAAWPLVLNGHYGASRGEWYFPKGTSARTILSAAGDANGRSANGEPEAGLFDPLIDEIDEHGVEVHAEDSPRIQAVKRAVKAWTDQLTTARRATISCSSVTCGLARLT